MSKPINRVVVLHGYAGSPEKQWLPWLQAELEKLGVAVTSPALPSPLRPQYAAWLKAVRPIASKWDDQTLIVAHSLGGVLALRALEKYGRVPVRGVVLVSSPFTALISVKQLVAFFEAPVSWSRLRELAHAYYVVHAVDDPLVPHDHALRYAEALGAEVNILSKGGHLNAKKVPYLLRIIKRHL